MIAKHHLACRRPDRLGAGVMPMITTPGHGSFPSAHAAEAFAVRTVLDGLLDHPDVVTHYTEPGRRKELLKKQAERIAVNRTVAGMHYPIDTWAGAALGEAVGEIILTRCGARTTLRPRDYAATNIDFFVKDFLDDALAATTGLTRQAARASGDSKLFVWLWNEVVGEFALA
jgi:membrane-associated phospholipid phosphatase